MPTIRCTALTKIDIDARRLTDAGAAAVADALPRLRSVALHHGYGLSGIGCLTSRPRSRTNDDDEEDDNNNDENETGHNRASLMGVVTQNPPGRPSTVTLATPLPLPPPPPPPLIMKPVPYIALRSLTLCSLGPSYDFLSYSYSSTWSRLARQWIGIPTMRSLTLINNVGDMNFLPLLEIAPFFPKPTPRADGGSGARRSATFSSDDHRDPGRAPTRSRAPALPETQGVTTAVNAPAKKNDGVRAVRRGERRAGMRVDGGNLARVLREGHRKKTRMEEGLEKGKKDKRGSGGGNDDDNDDGTVGLLELSLAAVTWKDVVEALDVQPRFRVIRHRVMQGPSLRPLWVRLRRLSLVLDEVTDELCAAVAGGCPELHEVFCMYTRGGSVLRSLFLHKPCW